MIIAHFALLPLIFEEGDRYNGDLYEWLVNQQFLLPIPPAIGMEIAMDDFVEDWRIKRFNYPYWRARYLIIGITLHKESVWVELGPELEPQPPYILDSNKHKKEAI